MENKRRKKSAWNYFFILNVSVILLVFSLGIKGQAQDETGKKDFDIVFALDVSGSMKTTDENKISIEIIKMIVDICSFRDGRIGFIAYNDTVAYAYELIDISDKKEAFALKKYIQKVEFKGETDIGLGLKKAVDMLVDSYESQHQPMVILLSDGKTDLRNSSTGRTVSDSEQDMQEAIKKANEIAAPIYTVGLNSGFNSNIDYLNVISKQTGGKAYSAASPFQLLDIISSILGESQNLVMKNAATVVAKGKEQKITLDVNSNYMDKMKIILLSTGRLKGVGVEDETAGISSSQYYSVIELDKPETKSITLHFQAVEGSNILINLCGKYSFGGKLNMESDIRRNSKERIKFHLMTDGQEVQDQDIYSQLEFKWYLINMNTGEKKQLAYEKNQQGIETEYVFDNTGSYKMQVEYAGGFIQGCYESDIFTVENQVPLKMEAVEKKICIKQKKTVYQLSELFGDSYDGKMSYVAKVMEGESVQARIEGGSVVITPNSKGKTRLLLTASYEDGNSVAIEVTVWCLGVWSMYQTIIVGIAIGLIILLTLLVSVCVVVAGKRKRKTISNYFSGVLTGYFVDVKSANEMPTMKWELSLYSGSGVNLSELLESVGIRDNFLGAERIWFYPKSNTEIQLVHNSIGSIFVGTKLIGRNNQVTVYSGEKMFIGFEENGAELELRYKA